MVAHAEGLYLVAVLNDMHIYIYIYKKIFKKKRKESEGAHLVQLMYLVFFKLCTVCSCMSVYAL